MVCARILLASSALVAACTAKPSETPSVPATAAPDLAPESGPRAPRSLSELESQLLTRELDCAFAVVARGAISAAFEGRLRIHSQSSDLTAKGQFAGRELSIGFSAQPQDYSVTLDGQTAYFHAPKIDVDRSVIIGLVRMGILHNLARMTGLRGPDHARGDVDRWVRSTDERNSIMDSRSVAEFDLIVSDQPSGHARLEWNLGAGGLTLQREQRVEFESGEMQVTESFACGN